MKRSAINDIIRAGDEFIRSFGFVLPPFAYWSPGEMRDRRPEIGGILAARLGWDITDYGQGRFDELGLFLFTVRNGLEEDLRRGMGMCYAEKIMISRKDQISPMHRHIVKAEDIINRGVLKISAREVEDMLLQHSLVKSATIIAVPDNRLGEKSCVFVVPRGERAPRLEELTAFLDERGVAKYKLPEFLVVVDALPMTPSGKIQKFVLRDGIVNGHYVPTSA